MTPGAGRPTALSGARIRAPGVELTCDFVQNVLFAWYYLRAARCRLASVGAKLLQVAFVRLLAFALVLVSAGCGSANDTQVAAPAPSEIAAEVMLPTVKELYRPIAGEGALWLRDVDTGTLFRIDPVKN